MTSHWAQSFHDLSNLSGRSSPSYNSSGVPSTNTGQRQHDHSELQFQFQQKKNKIGDNWILHPDLHYLYQVEKKKNRFSIVSATSFPMSLRHWEQGCCFCREIIAS